LLPPARQGEGPPKTNRRTPPYICYIPDPSHLPIFSLDFLGFIAAFSGVSQRWEIKNTTKNVLQKKRVEKFLQKNDPKKKKSHIFLYFSYHVYVHGRFSVRGVKNSKKNLKKKSDLP
jgi:hypothetical protein